MQPSLNEKSGKTSVKPKKVDLFPEIGRVKKILLLTRPHSRMCVSEYIFLIKKNKQTNSKTKN